MMTAPLPNRIVGTEGNDTLRSPPALPLNMIYKIIDLMLDDAMADSKFNTGAYDTAYYRSAYSIALVDQALRRHVIERTEAAQQIAEQKWSNFQAHNLQQICLKKRHKGKKDLRFPTESRVMLCADCEETLKEFSMDTALALKLKELIRSVKGKKSTA